ncbi:hypothetical protein [Stenotrophomonas sp. NPDC078853]|uniref:hypothetical protein n=1 Tax=Stenotrophomonas sp. NPDC078853 TaxID=3364534 RepID=UPI00384BF51C
MTGPTGRILRFVCWSALMFGLGWAWRGDRAEIAEVRGSAEVVGAALQGEQVARTTDRAQVEAVQQAADAANHREDRIDAEYQERVTAAVAGRDSELGRLRHQWAGCETGRLADGAAAVAEAAAENRLRRLSASRIVRACELAQSERDEAVDRYQAVEREINQGP